MFVARAVIAKRIAAGEGVDFFDGNRLVAVFVRLCRKHRKFGEIQRLAHIAARGGRNVGANVIGNADFAVLLFF